MPTTLRRWCRVGFLGGLLLLVACSSTKFVYNRLDFLLPWYVNDYAHLDSQQKTYFATLLGPFLDWHRHQELPSYVAILVGIENGLDKPQTVAGVAAVFAQMEAAWLRLEAKGLDQLLDLGARLSDKQVAGLMDALWKEQKEWEEKYLKRTDEEFYDDSYHDLVDSTKEYLGTLSDAQRKLLRESSRRLLRSDRTWLGERALWLQELAGLLKREPQWQQRLRDALARQREHPSAEYQRIYEHNLNVVFELIATLLNGRSAPQDEFLRNKLATLQTDLEALSKEPAAAPH